MESELTAQLAAKSEEVTAATTAEHLAAEEAATNAAAVREQLQLLNEQREEVARQVGARAQHLLSTVECCHNLGHTVRFFGAGVLSPLNEQKRYRIRLVEDARFPCGALRKERTLRCFRGQKRWRAVFGWCLTRVVLLNVLFPSRHA